MRTARAKWIAVAFAFASTVVLDAAVATATDIAGVLEKMNSALTLAFAAAVNDAPAAADVHTVLEKMNRALAPGRDMRANVTLTLNNGRGEKVQWSGRLYRRMGADPRLRFVLDSPLDVRGTDVTVTRTADNASRARVYLPAIRRVREITGDMRGESFLGTDFTYEDLGFQQMEFQQHALLRDADLDGHDCYRVESRPARGWWYGRIVRWIDKRNFLPRRTEYFDRQSVLWKLRTFDDVRTITSHPTWTSLTMTTVPAGTSTTIALRDVEYDTGLTSLLFEQP
jgi:outer membrane lipoprotein-sorting protein